MIGADLSTRFAETCRGVEISSTEGGDFAGDRRAARGFNGDLGRHIIRWRHALDSGEDPGPVAQLMARKSLLAVAGLVSIHDRTWTTDRETSADRWGDIAPEHQTGLTRLKSWTSTTPDPPTEKVREVLDGAVETILSALSELIGLWPDTTRDSIAPQ